MAGLALGSRQRTTADLAFGNSIKPLPKLLDPFIRQIRQLPAPTHREDAPVVARFGSFRVDSFHFSISPCNPSALSCLEVLDEDAIGTMLLQDRLIDRIQLLVGLLKVTSGTNVHVGLRLRAVLAGGC